MQYCFPMSQSWKTECSFYADTDKNHFESATISLDDVTFTISAPSFETSFKAMDVFFTEKVFKKDVLEFLEGKRTKVGRANPLIAFTSETVTSIEFEKKKIYLKFNVSEFKQLLSIAQAKQKYSKTVADRN